MACPEPGSFLFLISSFSVETHSPIQRYATNTLKKRTSAEKHCVILAKMMLVVVKMLQFVAGAGFYIYICHR